MHFAKRWGALACASFLFVGGLAAQTTPDTTAPTIVRFSDSFGPRESARGPNARIIILDFDEPVAGVDVGDFDVTTEGALLAVLESAQRGGFYTTNPPQDGRRWELLVRWQGSGTFRVTVRNSGTGIADLAGNAFVGGGPTTATCNTPYSGIAIPVTQSTTATQGQPFEYRYATAEYTGHELSFLSAPLPAGLTLEGDWIRGTPTMAGTSKFSINISHSTASSVGIIILTIDPAPPATWQGANIGAGTGSASSSGAVVSVSGSGADIWGSNDAFFFHHRSLVGDGEIVARLSAFGGAGMQAWAKAGLMFRDGTSASARNVFMCLGHANGTVLQSRSTAGGETTLAWGTDGPAPRWLRLVRAGSTFTGYDSADGVAWRQIATLTLGGMPDALLVGLAVSSHETGVQRTATFENVTVGGTAASTLPPAAPSGLQATAVSQNEVDLTWTDNSSSERGFRIERETGGGGFGLAITAPANATRIRDGGLFPNTTYTYRISAFSDAGQSAYSAVVVVTTPPNPPPPGGSMFTTRDIGTVNPAGSATYDSAAAVWTVAGGGADIWNNVDAFTSASSLWGGDGEIVARVSSVDPTHPWAKAGLMFRESLAPDARNVFVAVTPGNGIEAQTRTTVGGATVFISRAEVSAPMWLKLTREGNIFRAYRSTDGVSWMDLGGLTLALPGTLHVGLAVTSHAPGSLSTARFSDVYLGAIRAGSTMPIPPTNVQGTAVSATEIEVTWNDVSGNETGFTVDRGNGSGTYVGIATLGPNATRFRDTGLTPNTTYTYRVAALSGGQASAYTYSYPVMTPASPPPPGSSPPLDTRNIGTVNPAGSATYDGATRIWSVAGGGADIWNTSDAFTFQSQQWTGDGQIIARVRSLDFTHVWAKAGVMFRASLAASDRNIFVGVTPDNGIEAQARTRVADPTNFVARATGTAPVWLKLTRQGTLFRAYYSADGQAWTDFGSVTMDLPETIYVGLAVTSHEPGVLCTARFSDVTVGPISAAATTPPLAPTNLSATALSVQQVELRWTDNANNETGGVIERSTNNVSFAFLGSFGVNVTSFLDGTTVGATTYYYRVRVSNAAGSSGFSTTSVTTPTTSTPLPAPSNLTATAVSASQVNLSWTDNSTNETRFMVERSVDGVNFPANFGADANATTLSDFTTSPETRYYYRVRAVRGDEFSAPSATVQVTTPAGSRPWFRTEVGNNGVAGSYSINGTTITLRGSGADIWGHADGFSFMFQRIPGDCIVEAQVTDMTNTHPWSKAGVMIRESVDAGSRNVFLYLTPTNDTHVQARGTANQETSIVATQYGTGRPYWIRLERRGTSIIASTSPNGVTWQILRTHTLALGAEALVGFAVTSHDNSALASATFADPFIR